MIWSLYTGKECQGNMVLVNDMFWKTTYLKVNDTSNCSPDKCLTYLRNSYFNNIYTNQFVYILRKFSHWYASKMLLIIRCRVAIIVCGEVIQIADCLKILAHYFLRFLQTWYFWNNIYRNWLQLQLFSLRFIESFKVI